MQTTRRNFLRQASLAAGAIGLAPLDAIRLAQEPLKRTASPKRVVIIGAGLAGLSAGYELTRAGHDVTILEARTRAGGRVYTLREPFSDGLYAEAGATWIPNTHEYTLTYVKEFGLELENYYPENLKTINYIRGKRYVAENGTPLEAFKLTDEEKTLGLRGLGQKFLRAPRLALGNPAAPDWRVDSFKEYDDSSYADFFRKRGASEEAVALLTLGALWGDGVETVSALTVFRDSAHIGYPAHKIKGGNDLLPKAFAERLREKILYG
ncbi:MAG TPA: FAD-dependent oxidoreductase, partial [Blastocatellia bacterium]|nr:FAD-dependent oxidoreductase [Blastocatellia bacterium]